MPSTAVRPVASVAFVPDRSIRLLSENPEEQPPRKREKYFFEWLASRKAVVIGAWADRKFESNTGCVSKPKQYVEGEDDHHSHYEVIKMPPERRLQRTRPLGWNECHPLNSSGL